MNCFQIIIFVTSETTERTNLIRSQSCELLSNYYLCDVRNNLKAQDYNNSLLWIAFKLLSLWRQKQLYIDMVSMRIVVNCFQIIIFVTSETTNGLQKAIHEALWIAFKLLSLWRQKQPYSIYGVIECGCELLSNYYLCDVRNNKMASNGLVALVVNCFQIIIFVTSETTKKQGSMPCD